MKAEEPHCTRCAARMYRAHVRRQVEGKRTWVGVGWWCPVCGSFVGDPGI